MCKVLGHFGGFYIYTRQVHIWGNSKQNSYLEVNKNLFLKYNNHIDCVAGWKYIL